MGAPFKMKGSPMQRNFGIGSPMRDEGEKTSLKGKLKSAWYAIKSGFTSPQVDTHADVMATYRKAKQRSRAGKKVDIGNVLRPHED